MATLLQFPNALTPWHAKLNYTTPVSMFLNERAGRETLLVLRQQKETYVRCVKKSMRVSVMGIQADSEGSVIRIFYRNKMNETKTR